MNPRNLTELLAALDSLLDEQQKQQIRNLQFAELSRHHFSLGILIRNGFIHSSSQYFGQGISLEELCADTFSALICQTYWLHLHSVELSTELLTQLIDNAHWLSFDNNAQSSALKLLQGCPLDALEMSIGKLNPWDSSSHPAQQAPQAS